MITYVYETIPGKPGEKARHFEIKQDMNDAPLTRHPKTGKPIRRVILGGYGALRRASSGKAVSSCGCGKSGCCG
jgi:predicted nucleic acid-binding Zn ribbon protein